MAFSFKVIPAMALTVGSLGEKLRAISKDANLSAASLAAYLNEVSLILSFRMFLTVVSFLFLCTCISHISIYSSLVLHES